MENRTSNPVATVIVFFVLLFVFAKWGPAINFSSIIQTKGEPMVVSGQGKATAVPDIAKVSVGIQGSGPALNQVQDDVNKKSQSLVASLKKLDIDEKDIKTTSYNIYPQQDYQANPPRITGYQVSIDYQITIRDIDKVNTVLTAVTSDGANLVGGVTFDLSDESKAKALDAARKDAVMLAKQNAESLAKASGVTLGKITNISESQASRGPIELMTADVKSGGSGSSPAAPNIQPGESEINLTVSLTYEVR